MAQAALAMAVSLPMALMTMLAVPVELSLTVETLYSFVLFSAIIAVPFFFSGVAVCLSLTKTPFPIGRVYFCRPAGRVRRLLWLRASAEGCGCAKRRPGNFRPAVFELRRLCPVRGGIPNEETDVSWARRPWSCWPA